ncbi:hypothetical protein ACLB1E_32485 [Escherichia coli]
MQGSASPDARILLALPVDIDEFSAKRCSAVAVAILQRRGMG